MVSIVAGKLDEISVAIGTLRESTVGLRTSFDKHCVDDDRRHGENVRELRENSSQISRLNETLIPLVKAVEAMKPVVEQYRTSRFKLAGAAGAIMMLFGFIGWLIQTFISAIIHGAWKLLH